MIVWPRMLIGFVVLICTEVFSGASVAQGLWHPWTWVVTFWLYFAHFFLFTTLAVRTGRTSLASLYLWGVLFGLYESWITKVIWHGYEGTGKCVLGKLGPFGFSELSMVFLFHPVMAFVLPLAVGCLLFPGLRRWFPDLAWITGPGRRVRGAWVFGVLCCGAVLGMNSGGPFNLVLNVVFLLSVLGLLLRMTRNARAQVGDSAVVVLGRRGLLITGGYLLVLYEATYLYLRPDGLPSVWVQLATLALYGVPVAGLWIDRRREPEPGLEVQVTKEEWRRVLWAFGLVLGMGLVLSVPWFRHGAQVFSMGALVLWTPLGFVLTGAAWWRCWRGVRMRSGSATGRM